MGAAGVSSQSYDGPRSIGILGSTGSIGTQTLDIVRLFPERFRVQVLAAGARTEELARQALEFRPELIVIRNASDAAALRERLSGEGIRVAHGKEGLVEAAAMPGMDLLVAALVGFAGLESVYAALGAGKVVALANKEALVVAGSIMREVSERYGGRLLPVDSEHSAILQCIQGEPEHSVESLQLTASGGPFRTRPRHTFGAITPEEALRHPNWQMGAKVTIDSATLMNKGLEVIEARWLFGIEPGCIEVLVHPQSIIHSMVTFTDGSAKAQLGLPDMRIPIQYALSYPERWEAPHERIDWGRFHELTFELPDFDAFPCLRLAYDALAMGGTAPAVLNAANEVAVARFLEGRIRFTDIPVLVERTLERLADAGPPSYADLFEIDSRARGYAKELNRTPTD